MTIEEKILDVMNQMEGIGGIPSQEEYYVEFDMRVRAALGLASNGDLASVTHWVAVEDRLPEVGKDVLIFWVMEYEDTSTERVREVASLNSDGTWFKNWKQYPPTHWAEILPEPPPSWRASVTRDPQNNHHLDN